MSKEQLRLGNFEPVREEYSSDEIPPGYKKTDVGVIPEDWNIETLDSICDVRDGTHDSPRYFDQGVPFITSKNIENGRLNRQDVSFISKADAFLINRRSKVDKNDILMSMIGTVGDATLINFEPDFCIKNVALIKPRNISPSFLINHINSTAFQSYLLDNLYGGIQSFIALGTLRKLKIPIPPEVEQNSIAEVLTDVDNLIESLDNLIRKKQAIKEATMQQLLTGRTRLPGFCRSEHFFESIDDTNYKETEIGVLPSDWHLVKLPDVVWYQEGPGVRDYQFTNYGVKLFNGTNIENGKINLDKTVRHISEKEARGRYSHFLADAGDIVIACSGISVDKFDEKVSAILPEHLPLCMNTSTMRFKVTSSRLQNTYFRYFLKSRLFKNQISGKATGSAQLNFGPSHVGIVLLPLPSESEQYAISNVLSSMDAEIEALERQRDKMKQIKQGMMQQLLTGRIRMLDKEAV